MNRREFVGAAAGVAALPAMIRPGAAGQITAVTLIHGVPGREADLRTHLRTSFEKRQREGWTTQIMVFERVPE